MTRLECTHHSIEEYTRLADLRELHIYQNSLSEAWLNGCLSAATKLTLLAIGFCSCKCEQNLIPPENLR